MYDYFDGHDQLHNLYGVIFLFLDSDVLVSDCFVATTPAVVVVVEQLHWRFR